MAGKKSLRETIIFSLDSSIIHLDPHFVQPSPSLEDIDVNSFHGCSPRKIPAKNMDPSAAVGFYCKTKKDFINLEKDCNNVSQKIFKLFYKGNLLCVSSPLRTVGPFSMIFLYKLLIYYSLFIWKKRIVLKYIKF